MRGLRATIRERGTLRLFVIALTIVAAAVWPDDSPRAQGESDLAA